MRISDWSSDVCSSDLCDQTRKAKFKYPAWTAGLDYKINDALFVYAKTSGASMSGGWNIRDTFAPAFKPENVRDVEVGVKADLLDRRLRANAAFFYAWQSDVQRIINKIGRTSCRERVCQYV